MKQVALVCALWLASAAAFARITVVSPPEAGPQAQLATKEIARYVYLRTGTLPVIKTALPASGEAIVLATDAVLGAEAFAIRTATPDGLRVWTISGGSGLGQLYGAYRFAEKLGVRFYLHGDVVPDERLAALPDVNEDGKPLFALRGVNPWGSHPFGFDAWSADDYKAIFTQLAKMRMNFLGIHCYPEGHPYAEPTVWHGLDGNFDAQGRVKSSYVSRYFNTLLTPAWGDYLPKKTSDYNFGGALLFERDDWAPPVLKGYCPLPQTPQACNDVFNRLATQFHDAFAFARQLGVKTCIGTEAPVTLPKTLAQRTNDVRAVYEGTFRRIMASHPLDYYWLWTPESWTWEGNRPAQYSNTVTDINLAIEALKNVNAPFKLATAGWVLGPAHDRAAFDNDLPKNIPMSAISRNTGATEVDPAFGRIAGREKWAIPWLESDNRNGLAAIQLEAGRMRRDAADALAYGCTGLMGLHWRTEILSPNIAALAQAAWDQSWNAQPAAIVGVMRELSRCLPCDDFYADWARANFGQAEIGKVFAAIDGHVPQVTDGGCPSGRLTPDGTPWSAVAPQFAFVDELAKLRPSVQGTGNLSRFDYWLNSFKYYRSLAEIRCALAQPGAAELTRLWSNAYGHLLATVNSPGALAMVVNMENHPGWGALVAKSAQQPWPKEYQGKSRIIVPCVRSVLGRDEKVELTVVILDNQPAKSAVLCWRPLGGGAWQRRGLSHVGSAIYRVALPPATEAFEYWLEAGTADGRQLVWPVTAPDLNQTVVVLEKGK